MYSRSRLSSSLLAYQASARGGSLPVRVESDAIPVTGRAVTVASGELADAALPLGRAGDAL
jgi:predicted PhzF superfamily epimerase YddE/YHI9